MTSASTKAEAVIDTGGELPTRVVVGCMIGVVVTMLMAALDTTIVETAMPRAIAEMNGFEHYTAVITMYLLASTAIVPIVGKLSDLYGRKPFLLVGIAIFVVGSALCGATRSMLQLVVFRGIQGIGAGFTQAMAFTTIADLFPPARRGRAIGIVGSSYGLATVIGPAVGGILTDGPGWRWCFYVNIPVGIAAFILLLMVFPQLAPRGRKRTIDWWGAALLLVGVVPILLGLSWAGRDYAWGSPITLSLLLGGAAVSAGFLWYETRATDPILPPSLFAHRVVWTSAAGSMIMSVAMFTTILFIPLFIQAVVGRSATQSGAVLTPLMLSIVSASMASGQILQRVGRYKVIAVVGSISTSLGLLLLAQMDVNTTYPVALRNMVLMGIGIGATLPVYTIAAQNAVSVDQLGVITSSLQFLRSMGGSLGAAVFGALLTNRYTGAYHRAIPPDVASNVGSNLITTFENPQALMNPRIVAEAARLSNQIAPVLGAVKRGLALAVQDVFLATMCLMIVGVGVSLALVELPLRKTNRPAAQEVAEELSAIPEPSFEL